MKYPKILMGATAGALALSFALVGCGATQQQPATTTAATTSAPATSTAAPATTAAAPQTQTQSQTTSAPQTQTQTQTQTTAAPQTQTNTMTTQSSYIGEDRAKETAVNNAGFAVDDVTNLKCELDTDDGTVHYDVEFKKDGNEYDYDINATTGDIMSNKVEVDD